MMEKQLGFSLLEIAIVLLIVGLLMGTGFSLVPKQQELKRYRLAKIEMREMTEALYAFAQVKGYLPCPAVNDGINNSLGFECRNNVGICDSQDAQQINAHSCHQWFAYYPAKTLSFNGNYSSTGLLLDPWGEPYRYQVTDSDCEEVSGSDKTCINADGDGLPDFVFENEMQGVGIQHLEPDLAICDTDLSATSEGEESSCTTATKILEESPAVILSLGNDRAQNVATTSWVQRENLDNDDDDKVFVSKTFSDVEGEEYDDLVKWLAPNILYSKLIKAGKLP